MSESKQTFSVSRAQDATYKTGLRSFMEYRDLGISDATGGQFRAHVIRIKKDGPGAHTFREGDCVLQPAAIVHNELECSDDVEVLEIYSPAVHETRVVDTMPEATAAH